MPGSGIKLRSLFLGCFGCRGAQIVTSHCGKCCEGRVQGYPEEGQKRGEGLPPKARELNPKSWELVISSSE